MADIIINAMGQNCPVPVVMTTKELNAATETGTVATHVDNEVAVQNLLRLAAGKGLEARSEKTGDNHYVVTIAVNGPLGEAKDATECEECSTVKTENTVVVISSDRMGEGNDELGKVLIKGFIYAVSQLEILPKTIIFYNGGAALPVEGSDSLEDLKNLESRGVEILTCGTCLDYYNLKEKLAAGSVSNMYTIVETIAKADKVIRP